MIIKRRYAVLDVFTQTPLAGNPLAVVLDSEGLDGTQMQAIAAEFNLSETVFVLPPKNVAHRAKLRIFTPAYELPFAGHPTIGTAIYLALQDGTGAPQQFILEAAAGPIYCDVEAVNSAGHARFALPKLPQKSVWRATHAEIATALSLRTSDIMTAPHAPVAYGAGNAGFGFVPVHGLEALGRVAVKPQHWDAAFGSLIGAYIYTADGAAHYRSRMVDLVVGEDPATGSAVAAFAGVLAEFETLADGVHDYTIGQGFEMNRPSRIALMMEMRGGTVQRATIAGDAVVVAEGVLSV
jgi:trans-2,3-dihydro-3-hydroxyanthranilate isomerase